VVMVGRSRHTDTAINAHTEAKLEMKCPMLLVLAVLLSAANLKPQAYPGVVRTILDKRLQAAQVVTYQLQLFLESKVPVLKTPPSAEAWTAEEQQIREHLLDSVVFHGWPGGIQSRRFSAFPNSSSISFEVLTLQRLNMRIFLSAKTSVWADRAEK